jgi:type I restriction enzyme R subunit
MRDALPNATFIGFTGAPLERDDRSTRVVFGDYADIYDIRQAIDDNATVPIYYDMRLVKLLPDDAGIREAEDKLKLIAPAAEADAAGRNADPTVTVKLQDLAGAERRVTLIAGEIVEHFEKRREVIEGKAMAVCMSRDICMGLYDRIVVLRPEWHGADDDSGFVKVIMTGCSPGTVIRRMRRKPRLSL